MLDVDARETYSPALRILYESGRMIEPHRLVVEERRVECGRKVCLQICARIGEQRKARRMRFGEPVQCEGCDRRDDLLSDIAGDPLARHPLAQLHLDLLHPSL